MRLEAMRRSKQVVGLIGAVASMMVLAACSTPSTGSSEPSASSAAPAASGSAAAAEDCTPSDTKKVGVMFFNIGIGPDIGLMAEQVQKSADKYGVTVNIQDGKGDPNAMIAAIRGFIAEKSDAIIIYPPDPESLAPVLDEAGAAGIPVFPVNLKQAGTDSVVTYVGADDYVYGQKQMEILKQSYPDGAKIALLMGSMGTSAQIERTRAVDDFVKENPQFTVVDRQVDDWDSTKSLNITREWLTKYPKGELDAIVVQGPQAGTSVDYANSIGRDDVKWIFGDFIKDNVAPIKAGSVLGTVKQDFVEQADVVTKVASDWISCNRDGITVPNMYLDLPVVTQENVDSIEPAF